MPPFLDQFVEDMAGRACYSLLDLFVGYDHRALDISSRDLTTFQTPLGAYRCTVLPQGATNAVAIFHGDVTFILEPETPHVAKVFVDDTGVKGPASRYETADGGYETIPGNTGIRRFIWEHLSDVHRVLHRLGHAGATVSAPKISIAVPEVAILGHKCNYEGRVPEDSKAAKVRDWPSCKSTTDVRSFLGLTGFMRVWIKDYSTIARPLVELTRKDVAFVWEECHESAMQRLKDAILSSPALIPIDYASGRPVFLAVDSSQRGVGWILSQLCEDGARRPSRFGSLSWNERESRYSQAKVELYGLFRALRALRVHIVGVTNLVVEMDAQYVRGMLKHPDMQPNAAINRWIAAIRLFDFSLVHIPADKHRGPDGLSRREPVPGEDAEDGDPEAWIDEVLSLGVWASSTLQTRSPPTDTTPATSLTSVSSFPVVTRSQARLASLIPPASPPSEPTLSHESASLPLTDTILTPPPAPTSSNTLPSSPPPSSSPIPPENNTVTDNSEREQNILKIRKFLLASNIQDIPQEQREELVKRSRPYFARDGRLWRRQAQGRHQLVLTPGQREGVLREAHDGLGHKGYYSTLRTLLDRFWWPSLTADLKQYLKTCHECQIHQTTHVLLPPTVATPASLFRKAYIDTMLMPPANGFRYIVQARCSLTAWPEWRALRSETGRTLAAFIFEDILCRWGAVEEIVTDNGTPFVAALDHLASRYGIRHIRISAYNSRANAIVERQHRTIRESLVKACEGRIGRWPELAPHAFWADRATTRKSTGHTPFFMVHGVEPLLPFDITHATFLVPDLSRPLQTSALLSIRIRQLEAREADLATIHGKILRSRFASAQQFERSYENIIRDYDFKPGALVLVRNSALEMDLGKKNKLRYFGPMVVARRVLGGSYRLAELDGTISKLRFAAFRIVPYYTRSRSSIPVTRLIEREDLIRLHLDDDQDGEDPPQ